MIAVANYIILVTSSAICICDKNSTLLPMRMAQLININATDFVECGLMVTCVVKVTMYLSYNVWCCGLVYRVFV